MSREVRSINRRRRGVPKEGIGSPKDSSGSVCPGGLLIAVA